MTSVPVNPLFPPLPDALFRARLADVRENLLELEPACPPEHSSGLSGILEAVEQELLALGWTWPEPLTDRDRAVLAALGCPA